MYSVVETESNYYAIPTAWILSEGNKFAYPSKMPVSSRAEAIIARIEPGKNWDVFSILAIHHECGNYNLSFSG